MVKLSKTIFVTIVAVVFNLIIIALIWLGMAGTVPKASDLPATKSLAGIPKFENSTLVEKVKNLSSFGNLPIKVNEGKLGRTNPFAFIKQQAPAPVKK